MSNPCDGITDSTPVACSGDYAGCGSCYCSQGQMYVLCYASGTNDPCDACNDNPCGGSATTCTSNTSGSSTCYTCSNTDYDPATEVCPQADIVATDCATGGPPLGCASGGCTDGFRGRAGFRGGQSARSLPSAINSRRPGPLATVYARVRAKMLGHPNTHMSHVPARRGPVRGPTAHHPRAERFNTSRLTDDQLKCMMTDCPKYPMSKAWACQQQQGDCLKKSGFTGMAPHPPVPAHGSFGRPQYSASVGGCPNSALGPNRLAEAERKMWSLAASGDGTYNYNADAAMTPAGDMGQYHAPSAPMDYQTFVEDSVFGQETRLNHQRWATEVAPWSAGRARKVDTLEEANYVDWMGIRGPHNPVEVANPSQITELNPSDLARWGNRTRVGRTGGEPYECVYNWQG